MEKYKSNAQKRSEDGTLVKTAIIALLNCTELAYCYFVYNQGLLYLDSYIQDDAYRLERSPAFWNWWKNQWLLRDEELLIGNLENTCIDLRRLVYRDIHNGWKLATQIHPHKIILDLSYAVMIAEVIEEAQQQNGEKLPQNSPS